MPIGPWELLIILAIVIAIFGASRLAGIGGALGGSIREFKKAVKDDEAAAEKKDTTSQKV
ncbi:MAG: twin-arginine translocase TatA/TatE family subunit [Chloroflexaceae bacterium]|jgi:sec-independent protein translocase protein TatA|nr:twin-arginine translocase TatA/TatE family subunit [Chloroflexaceae bacterium]